MPEHAFRYGSGWACEQGYIKTATACVDSNPPEHAFRYGSGWACESGYYRSGGSCLPKL